MKIIITGGAGFIGSHIAEKYAKSSPKTKIIILDNLSTGRLDNISTFKKNVVFIKCDLSVMGAWIKYFDKATYVYHIASLADIVPSIEKPKDYFESNVTSTLNVLEACRKYNCKKIIYAASSSCYGIPKKYPTKENEKINPMYPYALTKYLGENLLMHWSKVYNIPVVSLRLFNVYGIRSRTNSTYGAVMGVFFAQKISKKPLTIVGSGRQKRDFVFIDDVVEAFILASKKNVNGEIFNIGSGTPRSINELANLISENKKIHLPKRPGEPDCTWANISKAKKLLGWKPKTNLETGVKHLINNISYWKNAPVWNKNSIKKATKTWFKQLK